MTIRDKIDAMIREASQKAQDKGVLPQITLPDTVVERPQKPEHGDYAVTAPLKLARGAGMSPLVIAQHLLDNLDSSEEIESVTLARPGFINFLLKADWLKGQIDAIVEAGDSYGNVDAGTRGPGAGGVRQRQPHGPATRGARAGGGARECACPDTAGRRLLRRAGVLHQRRRHPDDPLLPLTIRPLPPGVRH